MILQGEVRKIALKALAENRFWWETTDQYGHSCNDGDQNFRLDPATSELIWLRQNQRSYFVGRNASCACRD